ADADCTVGGTTKLGTGLCETTSGSCYTKCSVDADCQYMMSPATHCSSGSCVQCAADADCAGKAFTGCNMTTHTCTKCNSSAECNTGTDAGFTCNSGVCNCTADSMCPAS